jgi:hypothetical protein
VCMKLFKTKVLLTEELILTTDSVQGRAVVLVNLDTAGLLLVTNFCLFFLVSFICLRNMLLFDL